MLLLVRPLAIADPRHGAPRILRSLAHRGRLVAALVILRGDVESMGATVADGGANLGYKGAPRSSKSVDTIGNNNPV